MSLDSVKEFFKTSLIEVEDDELVELKRLILVEQDRRYKLEQAPLILEQALTYYRDASGIERKPGAQWVQPTGALDAYSMDDTVEHQGKQWVSTVSANVWEPGVSGWRLLSNTDTPAEFVQPTGGHDAYSTGDKVSYKGKVYESLINANTWAPDAYPQGWRVLHA